MIMGVQKTCWITERITYEYSHQAEGSQPEEGEKKASCRGFGNRRRTGHALRRALEKIVALKERFDAIGAMHSSQNLEILL